MISINDIMKQVIIDGDVDLRLKVGDSIQEFYEMYQNRPRLTGDDLYDLVYILENYGIETTVDVLYNYFVDIEAIDDSNLEEYFRRYKRNDKVVYVGKYYNVNGIREIVFIHANNKEEAENKLNSYCGNNGTDLMVIGKTKFNDDMFVIH